MKIITETQLNEAISQALTILEHNTKTYDGCFQSSTSINQFYLPSENKEWTTGFCTGQYWLAYELSKKSIFKDAAMKQVKSFYQRIIDKIEVDHHDMGFLYTPSCTAAYMLIESELGKHGALLAADQLVSRYQAKGEFIQAWGTLKAENNYRLIIDCLLNLPLLYWASDMTKNDIYKDIALKHTKTSLKHLIREDNSTFHTYFFDVETGEPKYGVTHQGYKDNSAWSRGQAWGIYGLALSYKHTQDDTCIVLFEKVTDFFIQHLPQDYVPYWDLEFNDGSNEPKDSSAAAIAICGIFEMAKYLPKEKADDYLNYAHKMLNSLINNYAVKDIKQSDGLLLHGVYAKNSPYNPIPEDRGVDECNTWGDYFYLEALTRLKLDWKPYW